MAFPGNNHFLRDKEAIATVNTVLNGHFQKGSKLVFKTNYCLTQVYDGSDVKPVTALT